MSAYSETVNVIMKSRVRESRTHGSVRGWHREVPVYSTAIIMVTGNISVIKAYDAVTYLQRHIDNKAKIFINVVRTNDNSDVCNVAIIATGFERTVK